MKKLLIYSIIYGTVLTDGVDYMSLKDYMELPYTYMIKEMNDESGHYWYGRILELDGCQSDGDSKEELLKNLEEVLALHLTTMLEDGDEIPIPKTESEYSGKFVLRVPKSLHFKLVHEAEKEGVSLNQYALYKLSR